MKVCLSYMFHCGWRQENIFRAVMGSKEKWWIQISFLCLTIQTIVICIQYQSKDDVSWITVIFSYAAGNIIFLPLPPLTLTVFTGWCGYTVFNIKSQTLWQLDSNPMIQWRLLHYNRGALPSKHHQKRITDDAAEQWRDAFHSLTPATAPLLPCNIFQFPCIEAHILFTNGCLV